MCCWALAGANWLSSKKKKQSQFLVSCLFTKACAVEEKKSRDESRLCRLDSPRHLSNRGRGNRVVGETVIRLADQALDYAAAADYVYRAASGSHQTVLG